MRSSVMRICVVAINVIVVAFIVGSVVLAQENEARPPLPPGLCTVPEHFRGNYFSIEVGEEYTTIINEFNLENGKFYGRCVERKDINQTDSMGRAPARGTHDSYIVFHSVEGNCYSCHYLVWRSANVVQYKYTECGSNDGLEEICSVISDDSEFYTYFSTGYEQVNCINTFEGSYNFTYEIDEGGGGICQSPRNYLEACQEPGSMYADNWVFKMSFGKCDGISTSMDRQYEFQCMGTWEDEEGNVWSAIADRGEDIWRDRYRCMLTRYDQELPLNRLRYTMSWWSDCSVLKNPYDGPLRLLMEPVVSTTQLPVIEPMCNYPLDYTGHWFHVGEYDVHVDINMTHLYFKTIIDQFTYKEAYFMCIMNTGTRYLTIALTVGKCEVDFICYDFLPREHSLIRWRIGKPYRLTEMDLARPDYLQYIFEQACWWSSFTIDREDYDWQYNVFILNPPSPVQCPIRGRYHYLEEGEDPETIGNEEVTESPRHQIGCKDVAQVWHTCEKRPSLIELDSHYCETVDHIGRPIGEFDCSDNELVCVGYYQENFKFFMYTWNFEDQASIFRCWNYERDDWRHISLTMSASARCFPHQTAHSHWKEPGISLKYTLTEAERLFDDCPTRYMDGTEYSVNEELLLHERESWDVNGAAKVASAGGLRLLWTVAYCCCSAVLVLLCQIR